MYFWRSLCIMLHTCRPVCSFRPLFLFSTGSCDHRGFAIGAGSEEQTRVNCSTCGGGGSFRAFRQRNFVSHLTQELPSVTVLYISYSFNIQTSLFSLYVASLRMRCYTTSRKVADYIPVEAIGFSSWPNPSSRTMTLSRLSLWQK
jgi:hypothetical protein